MALWTAPPSVSKSAAPTFRLSSAHYAWWRLVGKLLRVQPALRRSRCSSPRSSLQGSSSRDAWRRRTLAPWRLSRCSAWSASCPSSAFRQARFHAYWQFYLRRTRRSPRLRPRRSSVACGAAPPARVRGGRALDLAASAYTLSVATRPSSCVARKARLSPYLSRRASEDPGSGAREAPLARDAAARARVMAGVGARQVACGPSRSATRAGDALFWASSIVAGDRRSRCRRRGGDARWRPSTWGRSRPGRRSVERLDARGVCLVEASVVALGLAGEPASVGCRRRGRRPSPRDARP
jgi:hypothetical protein